MGAVPVLPRDFGTESAKDESAGDFAWLKSVLRVSHCFDQNY